MKKEVLYKCACGCLKPREEIVRVCVYGPDKKYNKFLRCVDHKESPSGDVLNKQSTCADCGCLFEFGIIGIPATRCPECKVAAKKKQNRENQNRYLRRNKTDPDRTRRNYNKTKKVKKSLRDDSRCDCKYYLSKCLLKYSKTRDDEIPCKGCPDYEPETLTEKLDHVSLNPYATTGAGYADRLPNTNGLLNLRRDTAERV